MLLSIVRLSQSDRREYEMRAKIERKGESGERREVVRAGRVGRSVMSCVAVLLSSAKWWGSEIRGSDEAR